MDIQPQKPINEYREDILDHRTPSEISSGILSLTPVTAHDIKTNPDTPLLRRSLKEFGINQSFSPILNHAAEDCVNKENILCNESKIKQSMRATKHSTPLQTFKMISQSTPIQNDLKERIFDNSFNENSIMKKESLRKNSSKTVAFSPVKDSIFGEETSDNFKNSPSRSRLIKESQESDAISTSRSPRKKKKTNLVNDQIELNGFLNPHLPYILSLYLQLFFNVVIVSVILYFIYIFISTVRADVENKVDSYASDIIQEIALCTREYHMNHCLPGQRVVALESVCSNWERCMNRDPTALGRAKIGAETFAEIINGFIKPISWKTMIFLSLITIGSLVLNNTAFGSYRDHSGIQLRHDMQHDQQQNSAIIHHEQNSTTGNLVLPPLPPKFQLTGERSTDEILNSSKSNYLKSSLRMKHSVNNRKHIPDSESDELAWRRFKLLRPNE